MSQDCAKDNISDDKESENEDMTKEEIEEKFAALLGEIWITSSALPFFVILMS